IENVPGTLAQDGHYCGAPLRPCAKEIIEFFKFPKAIVYSIAKSFKESEDIEEDS
ncbi:Hypothetical protein FKW44_006961, partial [Caligus rogercresseyi]